jgi:hypothetical protein
MIDTSLLVRRCSMINTSLFVGMCSMINILANRLKKVPAV